MTNQQEKLILETLFLLLESTDPRMIGGTHLEPIKDINRQKSKINDRLVELQKEQMENKKNEDT